MWHLASHIGRFSSYIGQNLSADPWSGVNILDDLVGAKNAWLVAPLVAWDTAHAERGDQLATFTGGTAGVAALSLMGIGTSWALRAVAPMGGPVGWLAVTAGSLLLTGGASSVLRKSVHRSLRFLKNHDRQMRRLEMGGWYQDTALNAAWRQNAIAEMSGSYQAARTYLGQEAAIYHR